MSHPALDTIKVLEVAEHINGPFCGKLLADHGAQVLKVETPQGDRARARGPFVQDTPHPEKSGLFLYLNTNKRGITLDLSRPTGADLFRRLVRDADVLIENYPPGALACYSLGYEALKAINPGLVMVSITPFGQTGPYRDFQATDLATFHMSGLNDAMPDAQPLRAAGQLTEFATGVTAAILVMAALAAKSLTGAGRHIDLSAHEAAMHCMSRFFTQYSLDGVRPTWPKEHFGGSAQTVPCADGHALIYFGPDHMFARLARLVGHAEWATDPRMERRNRHDNWRLIEGPISAWTRQRSKAEVTILCQKAGVPAGPVNTPADLLRDPHVRARGVFAQTEHPLGGRLTCPGAPFQAPDTPHSLRRPAPTLGQHNMEVLCGELGLRPEELCRLRMAGIV